MGTKQKPPKVHKLYTKNTEKFTILVLETMKSGSCIKGFLMNFTGIFPFLNTTLTIHWGITIILINKCHNQANKILFQSCIWQIKFLLGEYVLGPDRHLLAVPACTQLLCRGTNMRGELCQICCLFPLCTKFTLYTILLYRKGRDSQG